jgi:hypothetical protein
LVSAAALLGSALSPQVGKQPGCPEDRDDLYGIASEAIHDAEGSDDQLPYLGLAALRYYAT